ncbi:MAG TPA: ABC transporter ATP-binding protein [Candidatus Acetothermia bacterium]|nr:ABC transporter ATP-binding protein [Candidatus Acetothermia bacterium]
MIRLIEVTKTYRLGKVEIPALRGVSLEICPKDRLAIQGPSGSGKSTLLNLMGLLDLPTSGQVLVEGKDSRRLSELERSRMRNKLIGFVFQRFNLIPYLSAWENVALPGRYGGVPRRQRKTRAWQLLEVVGLAERAHHLPAELSGGEEQRVAIARALFMEPRFLLADEPTGNLDSKSGAQILALLEEVNSQGTAVVVVTHNPEVAAFGTKRLWLRDGLFAAPSP